MGSCCYLTGKPGCTCDDRSTQLDLFKNLADKPGSFLMAQREAFYAGLDKGDAYANGYISEDDTRFEVWYDSKFREAMSE